MYLYENDLFEQTKQEMCKPKQKTLTPTTHFSTRKNKSSNHMG